MALAFAGVWGDWITFPLSQVIRGNEISWQAGSLQMPIDALLFGLIVLASLLAPIERRSALILMSAALATLLLVPLYFALGQGDLIDSYVRQSQIRQDMTIYFSEQPVQNLSLQPTYKPELQTEGLLDQLSVSFAMLGWGWYLTISATLGMIFVLWHVAGLRYQKSATAFLVIAFLFIALQDSWQRVIASETQREFGDLLLVKGHGGEALQAYSRALKENPLLASSWAFSYKSAAAMGTASAGRHPMSRLAVDLDFSIRNLRPKDVEYYAAARKRLAYIEPILGLPMEEIERVVEGKVPLLEDLYWLQEGSLLSKRESYSSALAAFERSKGQDNLSVLMRAADAKIKIGAGIEAIEVLSGLDRSIGHPPYKADIQCSIGDAYTRQGLLVSARSSYVNCRELDDSYNFRATKALAGS